MKRFGVVVFPGANCDHDCYHVIKHVFKQSVEYVWHNETDISGFDCIILPGGFSYGDYLRAGAIARFSPVMREVIKFAKSGGSIIGICNGFQILTESGLLPGVLMRNKEMKFICKDVDVKVENNRNMFAGVYKEGQVLRIPIANADGNYSADNDTIKRLEDNGQIVFRYTTTDGQVIDAANPNGSVSNIAAIINKRGNVLGTMPHPERSCEPILGGVDGRGIFESLIENL